MLKSFKDLFDNLLPPAAQVPDEAQMLRLATAVLLVEVMRADRELLEEERTTAITALRGKFALADDEVERLLELAGKTARDATDYFAFTSRINEGFDMAQKVWMIEQMWRVAYADGTLSAHENHLMRKVADLLYIPHGAYVNAKMPAQQAAAAGLTETPDRA